MESLLDYTGTTNLDFDTLNFVEGIQSLLGLLLLIEIIFIIYMFTKIGKKEEVKSIGTLDQMEKLGKLKAQGLISDEEFEKEKKKLWEQ